MGHTTLSGSVIVERRSLWQPREIQRGEAGAERGMRRLRVRDLTGLRQVGSCSATQGLWLGDRKVGSQVFGGDRS